VILVPPPGAVHSHACTPDWLADQLCPSGRGTATSAEPRRGQRRTLTRLKRLGSSPGATIAARIALSPWACYVPGSRAARAPTPRAVPPSGILWQGDRVRNSPVVWAVQGRPARTRRPQRANRPCRTSCRARPRKGIAASAPGPQAHPARQPPRPRAPTRSRRSALVELARHVGLVGRNAEIDRMHHTACAISS
jgi:hypothetical protein